MKVFILLFLLSASLVAQQWELPITVTDGNANFELRLGVNPEATDGFDDGLDQKAPPPPPSGNFDTRWKPLAGSDDFFIDIRSNTIEEKTFIMTYQAASGFGPIILKWDAQQLADLGTFNIIDNITGTLFGPFDMTTADSIDISSAGGLLDVGIKILVTPAEVQLAKPAAAYIFDEEIGRVPFIVNFEDQSEDSDGQIEQWEWNFNDANTSNEQNPSHTYQEPGTYVVQLIVIDNHQLSDTSNQVLPIVALPQDAELMSFPEISNTMPQNGDEITVSVKVDMTTFGEDFELGSFSGSIEWNSSALQYSGNGGLQNNFTGVINEQDSLLGKIVFNGVNPSGVNGVFTLIDFNYKVSGQSDLSAVFDLEFSSMALAFNFKEINEFVVVEDDSIQIVTSVNSEPQTINSYFLKQNYPNPFNPETTIPFSINNKNLVKIQIFDVTGRIVKDLVKGEFVPGVYAIKWDGTDNSNNPVSSGFYFYKLETSEFSDVKRMLLLK